MLSIFPLHIVNDQRYCTKYTMVITVVLQSFITAVLLKDSS